MKSHVSAMDSSSLASDVGDASVLLVLEQSPYTGSEASTEAVIFEANHLDKLEVVEAVEIARGEYQTWVNGTANCGTTPSTRQALLRVCLMTLSGI